MALQNGPQPFTYLPKSVCFNLLIRPSEILKLKECFNSLDDDMSGSIGIDEMKEPLIGLGFANTTKEVEHMIELVDEDGSGMIEFNEFLSIIKDSGENE
jgi:Ca2+-binding EF-hand superfamily protein